MIRIFFLVAVLFFSLASAVFAQTFPKPEGYVNDFAHLYSQQFSSELEKKLSEFEASTSAEIAVVTIDKLPDMTIEDYAVKLFEVWKIGKEKEDNGVLLLIARDDREIRIEVGYGLEGVVTDSRAGRIIRDVITPSFKENNFEEGTLHAVEDLMAYVRGEEVAEKQERMTGEGWNMLWEFFPFVLFFIVYLASFLARSKEYYAGGIIGGVVGLIIGIIVGQLAAIIFLSIILGIIGLLLDYVLSRNYQYLKSHDKSTDWWHSRGGFSGGSSSGGFGGFGGGMSGGGGASGKW